MSRKEEVHIERRNAAKTLEILKACIEKPDLIDRSFFDDAEEMFGCIIDQPGDKGSTFWKFDELLDKIEESNVRDVIILRGRPGYGKTAFIKLLYAYCTANKQLDLLFLDLSPDKKEAENYRSSIEEKINSQKKSIEASDRQKKKIIFVDGILGSSGTSTEWSDDFFKSIFELDCTIVCAMTEWDIPNPDYGLPKKNYSLWNMGEIIETIIFKSVDTRSEKECSAFIEKFLRFLNPRRCNNEGIERISSSINTLELEEVDYSAMMMLHDACWSDFILNGESLIGMCHHYFVKKHDGIRDPGKLYLEGKKIFSYFVLRRPLKENERLLCENSLIKDYLLAWFIFMQMNGQEIEDPNDPETAPYNIFYQEEDVIHTKTINKFLKEFTNKSIKSQKDVLQNIKSVLESYKENERHLIQRAQMCYLMGRFNDQDVREQSRKILKQLFDKESDLKESADRKKLFFVRTVAVSLVMLGDIETMKKYALLLLDNSSLDDMDRGFHLEYYGDKKYVTGGIRLDNKDEPHRGCERTFEALSKEVTKYMENENKDIQYSIRAYYRAVLNLLTICSLVRVRNINGSLDEEIREKTIELIKGFQGSSLYKLPFVKSNDDGLYFEKRIEEYFEFTRMDLKEEKDKTNLIRFARELYKIKQIKRKGWINRGLKNAESVADHTFGALLFALMYLPDEMDCTGYSKEEIMKMLLIHDLAEAYTGDIATPDKGKSDEDREEFYFEYIRSLGKYAGIYDTNKSADLWQKFERKEDINSKIANDIDKIENLMQLMIYHHDDGEQITDYVDFKERLLRRLETDFGKNIARQIIQYYESNPFKKGFRNGDEKKAD